MVLYPHALIGRSSTSASQRFMSIPRANGDSAILAVSLRDSTITCFSSRSRAAGVEPVEIRDQLLHAAQIALQHGRGVLRRYCAFTAYVPDDASERAAVDAALARDGVDDVDILRRRPGCSEPEHRAEDDHDRTCTGGEQLELPLGIVPGCQHALAQLEQLAHGFLLELEPEIALLDVDAVERRLAVQHLVPLENVGVLHRKDVR